MSSDLNSYTHPDFGNLRTIVEGETIYICAKDAATALGCANTNKAIKDHCDGVTKRYPISDSMGREQEAVFMTEGDLYQLIFSSQLPAAKAFTSWVVNEVLPSIRRMANKKKTPTSVMPEGPRHPRDRGAVSKAVPNRRPISRNSNQRKP